MQTYELDRDAEVYEASGSFADVLRVEQPWPIEIPVAGLRPRNL